MWTNTTGTDRVSGEKWWETDRLAGYASGVWENENGVQVVTFGAQLEALTDEFFEGIKDTHKLVMEQSQTLAGQVDTYVPRLQRYQLDYLKQNYDPKSMSKEKYDALLEDLVQFGVITEQEKRYLNFTNCWITSPSGAGVVPDTFMEPPFNFESCGGNVYELARFHSQVEWLPYHGYGRFQDAQALTFGKLLKVFNQMGVR